MKPKFTPADRAEEYLKRVAALTGAQQDDDGAYLLTTGRIRFLVGDKFVRVISHLEQWREMQGYTFKADGQMFSGTHWR